MKQTNLTAIVLTGIILFLSSCALQIPIKDESLILGLKASDSVLIVLTDYNGEGNILPKGNYYPSHELTNGYLVYRSGEMLKVKENIWALYAEDICTGGIGVKINNPYSDYALFVENCNGEPHLRIDIPQSLDFEIKSQQ